MELQILLKLLRKWIWLLLLFVGIAAAAGYLVSSRRPPVYRATTTLLITGNSNEVDSDYRAILAAENLIPTYARQLTGHSLREEVQAALGLERWTAKVTTQSVADTQLLQLHVEDTNPERAREIANLLPSIFIEQETTLQQQRLATAEETLAGQLALVKEQIDETYAAINDLENGINPHEAERDRLQNQLYALQASQAAFTHSYQEVRLAQVQMFDPIMITEPAGLPNAPVNARSSQDTLLAAAVGGIVAMAIAFLVEYLDNSIKTPEDLKTLVGQEPLAMIPRYLPPTPHGDLNHLTQPRSPTGEAYRLLRTNLQLRTLDDPLQLLMVTSSAPGEGKSYTVANLGMVIAQAETPVILVDADLRQPTLHRLFELPNEQGLVTALLADFDRIDEIVQETAVSNLRVLTSGPPPPNPAEILSTQRMQQFIMALRQIDALIILDSPPLLAVADASILANLVDGTLLVVGAGETRPESLQKSLAALQAIKARILGTLLTKFRPADAAGYYYYNIYTQSSHQTQKGRLRWLRKYLQR